MSLRGLRTTSLAARARQHSKRQRNSSFQSRDARLFASVLEVNSARVREAMRMSHGQLYQDVFALAANKFARNNIFIDIGASDGYKLSNSYLLQQKYGWTGLLVDPNPRYEATLKSRGAIYRATAIVGDSDVETVTLRDFGMLSVVLGKEPSDMHSRAKTSDTRHYEVSASTLNQVISLSGLPTKLQYLSIDIEGSEFEALSSLDFSKYLFNAITVEHNHTDSQTDIVNLLTQNGYRQVMKQWTDFESWFVPE